MSRTLRRIIIGSLLALFLSACTTSSQVVVNPSTPVAVRSYRTVYLVTHGGNSSDMDAHIEKALLERGFNVTTGSDPHHSGNAHLIMKYVDDWRWDLKMYLESFDLMIYDGQSDELLAAGTWKNSALHGFYSAGGVVEQVVGSTVKKLQKN